MTSEIEFLEKLEELEAGHSNMSCTGKPKNLFHKVQMSFPEFMKDAKGQTDFGGAL